MEKIKVKIEGKRMLQHRFFDKGEVKEVVTKGVPDWEAEAEVSRYKDENGIIIHPIEHIRQGIITAAKDFKIPGKRQKTYKDLATFCLLFEPDFPVLKYEKTYIDKRPARVQNARILRYRPGYENWSLEFEITILESEFDREVVHKLLIAAGTRGIGDFRTNPSFGKYQVTKFEKAKTK